MNPHFRDLDYLETNLAQGVSPTRLGTVKMVVVRPVSGTREVLEEGRLDPQRGLTGDRWNPAKKGTGNQVTLMNVHVIELIAGPPERWPLAGDNLIVDFDLASLAPGDRLRIGTAEVEITPLPHTGCKKFMTRFGRDALAFVSSAQAKSQKLRGIHARVLEAGTVCPGDTMERL